ncbi:branched-chain amino acid transaminase [Candidatus Woesearchaeota archaeon]|nr:branched-chain amino acid transaminase [Candidatus Woesearchaeota archaeon]
MNETKYIWMDGKFIDWKDAKIHVLTHTLHYGMGVFEGIRFYETDKGAAVFRLKEHTKRLFNGAKKTFMDVQFSEEEINNAVVETIVKNGVKAGYIRPIFFYGYGKMGLDPHGAPVNCSIAVWPWGAYLGEDAVKVKTSKFIRIHPKTTYSECKICGHYVNSIFASCEAKEKGYNEALLLDYKGNVAEGPGENLFIVNDGKLITPKLGNILEGITRKSIIQIAKDIGLGVEEKDIALEDIYNADEAFFTGTAAEVTAICSLDDKDIGRQCPGQITTKLKELFLEIAHGKNKKYENWLTYVHAK